MKRKIINSSVQNMTASFNDQFYNRNGALMDEHTVPLVINRYYTDVNFTLIDKALVPANLKVSYPVYMFGQLDRLGAYKRCQQVVPPQGGSKFYGTFTVGINSPFFFSGANTIRTKLKTGDTVIVYTDDDENPNYFIWIVITGNTVAYSSIVGNTESTQQDGRVGALFLVETNYYVSNPLQFYQPFFFTAFDNIGNYRSDSLQPNIYLTPYVEQTGILRLDTAFKLDQYIGISFHMIYECDTINLDFKVRKV